MQMPPPLTSKMADFWLFTWLQTNYCVTHKTSICTSTTVTVCDIATISVLSLNMLTEHEHLSSGP